MKYFRRAAIGAAVVCATAFAARADLPDWMQSVASGSAVETALFVALNVPSTTVLYPRPPAQARTHLDPLITDQPNNAELYALRGHVEEQALDFEAAERDWQAFVAHSAEGPSKTSAQFALADFYHRRNEGQQEVAALEAAASNPTTVEGSFLPANQQVAWQAYERALAVAQQQGLGDDEILAVYRTWMDRYPHEPAARVALFKALLSMRRFDAARQAIDDYEAAFPADKTFPTKAAALLAFDEDSPQATQQALTLLGREFQPAWDPALVQSYLDLLSATHTEHAAIAEARAQLEGNPDDLRSAAFLFDAFVQQGRMAVANQALAQYAQSKAQRHAAWTVSELDTFATLLERAQQPAEAARFYYALASGSGDLASTSRSAEEVGLCGLIHLLLADGAAPIALGSGNLSILKDIAKTDQGPGYLNGILSLWLNSTDPAAEFNAEQDRAVPYFHYAKAAELLTFLDQRFPAASQRSALHAALVRDLLSYGDDNAALPVAKQFLADFPQSPDRLEIALDLADIDARRKDTSDEFALYDMLLTELSGKLGGLPLTASAGLSTGNGSNAAASGDLQASVDSSGQSSPTPTSAELLTKSLDVNVNPPPSLAIAQQYRSVLDRYLSRLVVTGQLPAALALLRRELDRNPNDPLLYERLAEFLQQNNFAGQEEAVYKQAIDRFQSATFYDKLARIYLRQRQQQAFEALTHQVVDTFHGTDLERYFANVERTWPEEYLQLNLYAHQRFPHDLVFTRNLLNAYQTKATADPKALEVLLRQHWQEAPDLQTEFFDLLSRQGRLGDELASLQALNPPGDATQQNPAAARELAEVDLWQSHFEAAAPLLGELANQYPADITVGDQAASVFRSLAYFNPPQALRAAAIEEHLYAADPANLDRLASIGDILADSTSPGLFQNQKHQLAEAAVFWRRMPQVHPGVPDGYLQSATVFWDYFQFEDALAEITAARRHFQSAALYAYQAGAIREGEHDEAGAISEYIVAATSPNAANSGSSEARARLITLATGPETAQEVDNATAQAAKSNPSLEALSLRADVLSAMHRPSDIGTLLDDAIAYATTAQQLAGLAGFAADHHLPKARIAAMLREIELTPDPVERVVLQYELVRVYSEQHSTAAQDLVDAIYAANPRIVGVVRSTVDFDWSHQRQAAAVNVLISSARVATPELAHDFALEAIDKSNRSGDYAGARRLLQPLLAAEPFNALYLNLQAQSYSLAHDDAGVRDLYTKTIAAITTSSLSPSEKRTKIALARQGLIPALTGLKDYEGAMDQHIKLLAAYPDDQATLDNAIAYARLYQRESQLVAFLTQGAAASPRDSRLWIDLARADSAFEDSAGALAAYSRAISIRSDRPELYIARAELEERAQNFEAACADYDRLFTLTYKDPQWMQKAALARARQGKPDLAVAALEAAYIEGRAPTAHAYFTVAQQLADWDLLTQADPFAARGVELAGDDLATRPSLHTDAMFYARLLARERKSDKALAFFAHLRAATEAASPSSVSVVEQQIAQQGLASVTDSEWRNHLLKVRRTQARSTFADAVQAVATTVAMFYTPEEKAGFATTLAAQRTDSPMLDLVSVWIPAAQAANLKPLEAELRKEVLLHGGKLAAAQLQPYDQLERGRMDFIPLAQTLDEYASKLPPIAQSRPLAKAAAAWRYAGDTNHEAVDLRILVLRHRETAYEQRLLELYLRGNPQALLSIASDRDARLGNAAANFLLAQGREHLTLDAIAAIPNRSKVWHSAMDALVGLYFDDDEFRTNGAFEATLGSVNIGDQLDHRPDTSQQLIGNPWFAYGTRYGLFLALKPKSVGSAEDFLPAVLEQAPSDPSSYLVLGDAYRDAHNLQAALREYGHALELDPTEPGPQISVAEAQLEAGSRDAALAAYRDALSQLDALVATQAVPETFWSGFARIANDAHTYRLAADLQPAMDTVLRAYIGKNGTYRSGELLQSAWTALGLDQPSRAAAWLLSVVEDAPSDDRPSLLETVSTLPIPTAQRGAVLLARVSSAREALKDSAPASNDYEQGLLNDSLSEYARWLLEQHRTAEAAAILSPLSPTQRRSEQFARLDLLLAAQQSKLSALLAAFRSDPDIAPSLTVMSEVANTLRLHDDNADSRLLLEFAFARKLALQQLEDADFLTLARARLDTGDLSGALDLLHRFTQRGDFYANLDAAASLLERTQHAREALLFLQPLAKGNPWDAGDQLRLAAAQLAAHQPTASVTLTAIASDAQYPYATRALAALALHSTGGARRFDSAELTALATAAPASQPDFVYAQVVAAQAANPERAVLLLRSALLRSPDALSDFIRLRLFWAEDALHRFEAARVTIEPVLSAHSWLRSNPASASESGTETKPPEDPLDPFTLHAAIPDEAARRGLWLAIAAAEERCGNKTTALEDLRVALNTEPPAAQSMQINAQIHSLQAALDLAAVNAQRRPVIQRSVVQSVVVRPRLTQLPEVHP